VVEAKVTYAPDCALVLERDPAVTLVPCHVPNLWKLRSKRAAKYSR
jgi:hypothetical protein